MQSIVAQTQEKTVFAWVRRKGGAPYAQTPGNSSARQLVRGAYQRALPRPSSRLATLSRNSSMEKGLAIMSICVASSLPSMLTISA